MKLYRYLTQTFALLALQDRRWKVGRLLELNDPLDCQPRYRFRGCDDVDPPDYFQSLAQRIGILCYSRKISDPVMWSHYGDIHKGIALGFEFNDSSQPAPVIYQEERRLVDIDKIRNRCQDIEEMEADIISGGFMCKAQSWSYEEEYRSFPLLQDCNMIGPHYFQNLPIQSLTEVVLGPRCPWNPVDIAWLLENLQMTTTRPRIMKASLDLKRHSLKIEDTLH